MRIYVGNLPFTTTDEELRETFEAHGSVEAVDVIRDRETGRSRGFGFVEMPDGGEAAAAIEALNEQMMGGRPLRVNEARARPDRGGGGRGGGGGGGGNW